MPQNPDKVAFASLEDKEIASVGIELKVLLNLQC